MDQDLKSFLSIYFPCLISLHRFCAYSSIFYLLSRKVFFALFREMDQKKKNNDNNQLETFFFLH